MPSTAIRRFHYDDAARVLTVTFVSGEAYDYFDVPPELPRDFRAAVSKGTFFQAHVRDRFAYRRVGREPADRRHAATQASTY